MFRLSTSQLFITYPQFDKNPEEILKDFTDYFNTKQIVIEQYIIAKEKHANGDDHRHLYLKLDKKIETRDANVFDFVGKHGNYQGCRSAKNVAKYCVKADDYISNFDVNEMIDASKMKRRKICEDLLNKRPLTEVVEENPTLLFGYKKLKLDLNEYFKDKEDQRGHLPMWLPNPWGKLLSSTLQRKKRHYWIYSRQPNKGKTYYFGNPLYERYKCGSQQGDFAYWNLRGDEECIILDEYNTGALKWSFINSMADGNANYRIFQGGVIRLRNPLIIVLSNQPIYEIYPNMNNLLYERFNEIELL